MGEPTRTELLLIACELAVKVECRPQRRDGTDAAIYASSGPTLARRIQAGAAFTASCSEAGAAEDPPYCWAVVLQAGAARETHYLVWLRESPQQLQALWLARKAARALRESLPHDQRKRKPWGPL